MGFSRVKLMNGWKISWRIWSDNSFW